MEEARVEGKAATVSNRFFGASYVVILWWWAFITFVFGCVYFILSYSAGNGPAAIADNPDAVTRFLDSLYFSIITGTSTGYGDIVPRGLSKAFTAVQSVSSIVLIALFVARFSSRRQDVALARIHELAFDSTFHGIRQGLYVARKDLDLLIRKVKSGESLARKDWRDLRIAFRQAEIFIRKVGDLDAVENRLSVIDTDRERLLVDAVERTMHRVNESLDILDAAGVDYLHQEGCIRELKSLTLVTIRVFGSEQERTLHPESAEAVTEILSRVDDILRHIERHQMTA